METQSTSSDARAAFFASPTNPSCGETQCNSHGTCVAPPDGGSDLVCDCKLGYQGKFCEDTINGALSVPLTLSVFGIIIGLVILAFVVAKLQRKKKKKQRRTVEALKIAVR